MLVVDCCDDCPGPKAINRCVPGTVHHGGWWFVDIIVVGCYAYTTQLELVIFLQVGFLVIAKGFTLPFFPSSMGSKTCHSAKKSKN